MNNDVARIEMNNDAKKGLYVTFGPFALFFFIFLISGDTLQLFIGLCSLLPFLALVIYIKNYDYKYYYLVFGAILTLQGLALVYNYLFKLKSLSLPSTLLLFSLTLIWIVLIWVAIYLLPQYTVKKEPKN